MTGVRSSGERGGLPEAVWETRTASPEKTRALGRLVGERAEAGDVLCLTGGLGAGKTTFVQGLAEGLGVQEPVASPTFTIVCEYKGRLPLYHADVYRLGEKAAEEPLGLEEYLEGDGVAAVEWAEWLEPLLPRERLTVRIEVLPGEPASPGSGVPGGDPVETGGRRIRLEARGIRYVALLEEVVARWPC